MLLAFHPGLKLLPRLPFCFSAQHIHRQLALETLEMTLTQKFDPPPNEKRSKCSSKMSGAAQPVCPKFISLEDRGVFTKPSNPNGNTFRVVSYNILAQVYVKSSLFPHSPSPCLKWKARSQAIVTVLNGLDADFLCLQELDEYASFYKEKMESQGYSSIYIQRSGQKRDGCGIFYKPMRAELMLEEVIQYNDLVNAIEDDTDTFNNKCSDSTDGENGDSASIEGSPKKGNLDDQGDPNDPRVRLRRDCVGLMTLFQLNDPSSQLVIVANTHIYWDPKWADVKLAQVKYLLERLSRFKEMVSDKYNCRPSVIVVGDFNSTPGDTVYQYVVSGSSTATPPTDIDEEKPIALCSLHAHIGEEPPFTNCTPDFTGTLDYIFFSDSGSLKPISFLELPGPESPDVVGGLPNYHHPSDHLPIGADFEVIGI